MPTIHATDIREFLDCRRKFFYARLERIKDPNKDDEEWSTIGQDGHKVLGSHYRVLSKSQHDEEDIPENVLSSIEGSHRGLLSKIYKEYKSTYEEEDQTWQIAQVERELHVEFNGIDILFTIDILALIDGLMTIVDHKFYKRMKNYGKGLDLDFQFDIYTWAGRKNGWNIKQGILNVCKKSIPEPPGWLKTKGRFSESQTTLDNTTYELFKDAILEVGQDLDDYKDTLKILKNKDSSVLKRFTTRRTEFEVEKFERRLSYILEDIFNPRPDSQAHYYINPGDACNFCQYDFLCKVHNGAGDYEKTRNGLYVLKGDEER